MRRIAIAGCGAIAEIHVWALNQRKDCAIVALCDTLPEAAEKLAKNITGKVKIYDNYEEMLEREKPDEVHLCTPHCLHVPMAVMALKKDISVFTEKPAAVSLEQLEQLKQAAMHSNGAFGVCFQNRYNASTAKLDALLASGEFGKVLGGRAFVTWRRDEDYYEKSSWKGRLKTEGGGVLMNQAIHTLDLLLRYLGEPVKIAATVSNHHTQASIEVEDTVEAWMEFADQRRGCFYASNGYVTDAPVCLELQCEKGRLMLTGKTVIVSDDREVRVISCEERSGIGKGYWGGGHLACIGDFYDCMDERRKFSNDLQGIYATMATTLKIYDAARGDVSNKAGSQNGQVQDTRKREI